MSTYVELCQKFRKLVGISGIGPASVINQSGMNEKITIWVADADEFVQRVWEDWNFLIEPKKIITATEGIATFTLADLSITDLAKWRKSSFVRNPGTANYQKLLYDMSFEDYLTSEEYLAEEVTGEIYRVIIRSSDDAVIFYPTPASNTTVWASYYKTVTRMSANTSTTPIPARFEDIILYRAKMSYAEHIEDASLYQIAKLDYDKVLAELESSQALSFKGMRSSNDDSNYEDVVTE